MSLKQTDPRRKTDLCDSGRKEGYAKSKVRLTHSNLRDAVGFLQGYHSTPCSVNLTCACTYVWRILIFFDHCGQFLERRCMGLPKNTAGDSLKKRGRGFAAAEISLGPCNNSLKGRCRGLQKSRCRLEYISAPAEDSKKGRCRGFPEKALQGIPKKSLQAGVYFSPCRGFFEKSLQGVS